MHPCSRNKNNSKCCKRKKEVCQRWRFECCCISPQPASWTPQSLWSWSGTVYRSPRPPCTHSSSSWSISLYDKRKNFACSDPIYITEVSIQTSSGNADLIGWWFRHCRMQTVWPGPWREAWMQHWWSRCSAPWGAPERRIRDEILSVLWRRVVLSDKGRSRIPIWLTSNSSSVSIWVCRTGMPFNSFSVVMVLITPSLLQAYDEALEGPGRKEQQLDIAQVSI